MLKNSTSKFEKILQSLDDYVDLVKRSDYKLPDLPQPWIEVVFDETELYINPEHCQKSIPIPFGRSQYHTVPMTNAVLLTDTGLNKNSKATTTTTTLNDNNNNNIDDHDSDHDIKPIYEITLDVSKLDFPTYTPGNTIGILPINPPEDVDICITQLGFVENCDKLFKINMRGAAELNAGIKKKKKPTHLPDHLLNCCSIRRTFSDLVNLYTIPKKLFIRALLAYIEDAAEKKLMTILCSAEGAKMYQGLIVENQITFADLIHFLDTCRPPFSLLLEHLPRQMPRIYSIINWSSIFANEIKIIFSVHNKAPGLTTSMLKTSAIQIIINNNNNKKINHPSAKSNVNQQHGLLQSSSSPPPPPPMVNFFFRKPSSSVHFQYRYDDIKNPLIMIGIGTSLAPYLSILDYRKQLLDKNQQIEMDPMCWLFYGCRYRSKTFIYERLLNDYLNKYKILSKLTTSFSRDDHDHSKITPAERQIIYVTDQIWTHANEFITVFLDKNSKIFISGHLKLISDVKELIVGLLCDAQKINIADGKKLLASKINDGKYVEDIWM